MLESSRTLQEILDFSKRKSLDFSKRKSLDFSKRKLWRISFPSRIKEMIMTIYLIIEPKWIWHKCPSTSHWKNFERMLKIVVWFFWPLWTLLFLKIEFVFQTYFHGLVSFQPLMVYKVNCFKDALIIRMAQYFF